MSGLCLSHAGHADQRLTDHPGNLRVAAQDLKIGCLAGLLRLLHDLPEHRLLGIFREKHRQHDAHRLRAGAGQIVYRNLYGKPAISFAVPVMGPWKSQNLVLSQLQALQSSPMPAPTSTSGGCS